jgi:copper(I)-binding protein
MRAGGYFTIASTAAESDRLVSASSPVIEKIEIHAIKIIGPDIQMRPRPAGLVIPPDYTTTLKPRGYHLLLEGVTAPLVQGARLPVTLAFEKAGEITIELIIREEGPVGQEILNVDRNGG